MFSNLDVGDTGHHFDSGGCFKWRYEKQGLSSLPTPVWFDKKDLATMHRRPCSSVQLMTVWAFLLYKNNSGAMPKIPQSNAGCTGRECAMERATFSNSEEGTAGQGDLFPRPQPHKGPCRCLITALRCLRKDTEPHMDCPESCSISMIHQSGRAQCQQRCPAQPRWPRWQLYGGVSQQYLVKTKFCDSGKDGGSPQDYRNFAISSH